jgi:micrococcal nuclease
MIKDNYTRNAELVRVIDGDTFECLIDMGLRIYVKKKIRVYGINCPEMKGLSKPEGQRAKKFAQEWFKNNLEFTVRTVNDGLEDSFGRLIAVVESSTGTLEQALLDNGLAIKFMDN